MSKFFDRLVGVTKPVPVRVEPVIAVKPTSPVPVKAKPGPKPKAKPGPKPAKPKHALRDAKGSFVRREKVTAEDGTVQEQDVAEFPFLNARFFSTPGGQVMTEVNFNPQFVAQVDAKFMADEEEEWDQTLPNNAKVALFLYAMLGQMVEPYLEPTETTSVPEGFDPMQHIPSMAVRGGVENKQIVDISKMKKVGQL